MSNIQVFTGVIGGKEQSLTTSRIVSSAFDKNHRDVLRSIGNLDCSQQFTERNFALSEYKDPTGRALREYRMTRDGFMFLAMGFTGHEAARRKEGFIETFNAMEARLQAAAAPQRLALAADLITDMLRELQVKVQRQEAQIEGLTRTVVLGKDREIRYLRQRAVEDTQRRIDRVIHMELAGYHRQEIVDETGLSFNYVRQILFRARRDGHLPAATPAQASLDLAAA